MDITDILASDEARAINNDIQNWEISLAKVESIQKTGGTLFLGSDENTVLEFTVYAEPDADAMVGIVHDFMEDMAEEYKTKIARAKKALSDLVAKAITA